MRRVVTFFLVMLLSGPMAAPTAAQSQTTTEELLSGMVTEEVEPGVYRIVNDGARDLPIDGDVVAGHDGSIWLVREQDGFVRLGFPDDESYTFPEGWDTRLVVAPDGMVWVSTTRPGSTEESEVTRTYSLEDGTWTEQLQAPAFGNGQGLIIAPDGTLWATHPIGDADDSEGVVVTRLGADGWEPLAEPAPDRGRLAGDLFVTRSEEVWLGGGGMGLGRSLWPHDDGTWEEVEGGSLWRYREDDGGWQEVIVDAMVLDPVDRPVEVGTDGTVWFAGAEPMMADGEPVLNEDWPWWLMPGDSYLMRFDGTEWQRWGPADGVPPLGDGWGITLRQAPDGGLWMAQQYHDDMPCSEHWGVARFDGSTWRRFVSGRCVGSVDMAPDGSVWLKATSDSSDDAPSDLYVITPEAVAATE
jgi:hypothetical protein